MTRYFKQDDTERTPPDLRLASPECAEPEPAPRWTWDGEAPTPFAIAATVFGLSLTTAGLALVGYVVVSALLSR